jgi:pimeloyl-ACP methyl ester carboxylesterase
VPGPSPAVGTAPGATGHATGPRVLVRGPVDAPPILFVHGTRMSATVWQPQLDALGSAFRVAAVDLPGHGTLADVPFTLLAAAARVAEAAEDLQASSGGVRPTVVGLSLGGYVALEAASARPDPIGALVLAGCSREPVDALRFALRALAVALDVGRGRPSHHATRLWFRARYGRDVAQRVLAGGLWEAAGAEALRQLVGRPFAARLSALPMPILVLNGALDVVFRPGGDRWAQLARDGRHQVLRGADHLSNLDRPDAFSAAVAAFVTECAAGSSDGRGEAPPLY